MDQPAPRARGRYAVITRLVLFLVVCAVLGGVLWGWIGRGGASDAPLPDTAAASPTAAPALQPTPAAFPTPAVEAFVNNDSLNLRDGPGQDYAVLGVFTQGTALVVL